jgi:hypothetical protein
MSRVARIGLASAIGLGALVGTGWLGLHTTPAPFPPPARSGVAAETAVLPADLPPPVLRYFHAVLGEDVPVVRSAIVTGRGHLRIAGVSLPARFRFTHDAGHAYRHHIEVTMFGAPFLTVTESYVDGHARLTLPFGVVENEPKVDLAANLTLWAEACWLPSVLATDPRVRWEPIDALTARLIVPFGTEEDSLTVRFDGGTGLIRQMEALRFKAAADAVKTPWRIEPLGWQTLNGIRIPSPVALTWLDEGSPWLVVALDDVAYNLDVGEALRPTDP